MKKSFSLFTRLPALAIILTSALLTTACATSEPSNTKAKTTVTKTAESKGFVHTQHYSANALLKNQYSSDRSLYRQAKYQASYASRMSNGYPLKNYIIYERLQLLPYLSEADVRTFLMAEKNTYIGKKIRERWLKQLADSGQWLKYEQYYNPNNASDEAHCNYFNSLDNQNRRQEALQMVSRFWLSSTSSPSNCGHALDTWRYSQALDQNLVWQRFHKVLAAGNTSLATQILPFFSSAQRTTAELYLQAYQYPTQLSSYANHFRSHPERTAIFANLITRLASQSPQQASGILRQYANLNFSKAQQSAINKSFSKEIDIQFKPFLTSGSWSSVINLLSLLPKTEQQKPKWSYWLARAYEQTGNSKLAASYYAQASKERDYYSFLAADKIRQPYQLNNQPTPVSSAAVNHMAQNAGIQRAVELYRLGEMTQARREWNHATQNFEAADYMAAAKVAQLTGWHQQAIFTIAKAGMWNDTTLRFPIAHESLVQQSANRNAIDSNWVYAIIRQESAFGYDANSHVGAQGLMQLMPATAQATARKLGLPYDRSRIHEEQYNISLGAGYLGQMSDRYGGNRILASAAYNAGPGRASRWLKETYQSTPADIWVENIPYKETRQYVKNVLEYNVVYALRRNQKVQMLKPQERTISNYY